MDEDKERRTDAGEAARRRKFPLVKGTAECGLELASEKHSMIYLRRVGSPGDRELLFSWCNLPDVSQYMARDHEITKAEHSAWYRRAVGDPHKFMVIYEEAPIGFVQAACVSEKDKRWTWGHYIVGDFRGRGIGKEIDRLVTANIFDIWGGEKIEVWILAWNEAVIRLHEKFGYRREGCKTKHVFKDGKWHDAIFMGMTSEEWMAIKNSMPQAA